MCKFRNDCTPRTVTKVLYNKDVQGTAKTLWVQELSHGLCPTWVVPLFPASSRSKPLDPHQWVPAYLGGASRYAFEILLQVKEVLKAQNSLMDIHIPDGAHFTVCGDIHGQVRVQCLRGSAQFLSTFVCVQYILTVMDLRIFPCRQT